MNNLPSYCGLVDARISASEKYLPVKTGKNKTLDLYKKTNDNTLYLVASNLLFSKGSHFTGIINHNRLGLFSVHYSLDPYSGVVKIGVSSPMER